MSLTQFCFSARQADAGLRSSLQKVAVGQPSSWAARALGQSGLRPERERPGHGSRFTAETARSVPSPSAPSPALAFGDNLNRLTNLAATHAPTSTPITNFGYQYDAAGNRTQKSTLDYTEDYGYDPLYRLTRADRTNPGATPPNQWTWNYDAVGNRTSAQKDSEATTSSYNEKNQLTGATGGGKMLWRGTLDEPGIATFSAPTINGQPARMLAGNVFEAMLDLPAGANTVTIQAQDGSGNIATKVYSVNVIGVPSSYTYDANGNLSAKTEGADSWTYTWNALNQLTAVSKNAVTQATYSYDPLGRRVERIATSTTTKWAYDFEDILRQEATTAAATSTTRFVHGSGIDEPMAQENTATSVMTYLHADALGSIVRHTSAVATITETIAYDAWGSPQAGNPIPYAFTGREWDEASGMYYYRARWYDARDARFRSEDPIGFEGGWNLTAYAFGQPTRFLDPSGLAVRPWGGTRQVPFEDGSDTQAACKTKELGGLSGCTTLGDSVISCKCVSEGCGYKVDMTVDMHDTIYFTTRVPERVPEILKHEYGHSRSHQRFYNRRAADARTIEKLRFADPRRCQASCDLFMARTNHDWYWTNWWNTH